MYYINKIVGWALSPLGVLFLGLAAAWLMGIIGRRRNDKIGCRLVKASRWFAGFTLALIWIMGCGATTRFVGGSLESEWSKDGCEHGDISSLSNADVIVVLGGGIGRHQKCGATEMFGAADRVWQGAKLFKAGKSSVIAMADSAENRSTIPLLCDFGVPKDAICIFPEARNTEEEAKSIFQGMRSKTQIDRPRILLVTSAWHMSRAKLLFERAGFDVIPAPTDFEMSCAMERPIRVDDFFPSAEALARNIYAIKEWIGNFGYRFLRR